MINLLDLEKDLRDCEGAIRCGLRHLDCIKNEDWFDLMESMGFLFEGRFLAIIDIIEKSNEMNPQERLMALESVACGLSKLITNNT